MPRVEHFLVREKKRVTQKPGIMRLLKTHKIRTHLEKIGKNPLKVRVKSADLQGFWSKSTYLKCFWTQFKTAYLQGPRT